LVRLIWAQ